MAVARTLLAWSCLAAPILAQNPATNDATPWDVSASHGPSKTVRLELDEGTWMNLDVSPDGSVVVFDLLGDIYAMPIGGGDATPLATGPAFTVQPRFSPDGRWIAYTSDAGGGDNLWIMKSDGTESRPVTKERFRLLNNPRWTPDGLYLVARKHFTSTRSLGAGEIWLYSLDGGTGVQLTKKRDDQHDAGEPELSRDGRYLYYSEDVSPGTVFQYNRDPNGLIYAIQRVDLETGEKRTVLNDNGGSARPELSPDGSHLAFVRRMRGKTVLGIVELSTGNQRIIHDGLSKDGQETWSIFGVYPNFAWIPDGSAILIWARGKIRRVDVGSGELTDVPFRVEAEHAIRDALRFAQDFGGADQQIRIIRWPQVTPSGETVIFQALGQLYSKQLPDGEQKRLTDSKDFEFFPSLSRDGLSLAYTTWNDQQGGRVMMMNLATGERRAVVNLPGHYARPSFDRRGKRLVYERLGGGTTLGNDFTINPGIYVLDLDTGKSRLVTRSGSTPRFNPLDEERVLLLGREGDDTALVSVTMAGHDRKVIATSRRAYDILIAPDGRHIAWDELFHAYVSPLPKLGGALRLEPGGDRLPVRKLTRDGGEFLQFSADGQTLYSSLASRVQRNDLAAAFAHDGEGLPPHDSFDLTFRSPADVPSTDVVLEGARVITMSGDEVIEDGAIWVQGNRIRAVGTRGDLRVQGNVRRVDLSGKTITPGFVDVHAHMPAGADGMMPRHNWPYLANLAFGVTTTHDPSNDTKLVFAEAELERAGWTLAPRIFSTGTVLYGAEGRFKAVIDSLDDARSHVRRLQAFGAFSVKSYNQPRRDQRQQVIQAASELGIMVVPEGGSTFFHNISMILDGHTTIEHALPVAPLYEDVLGLFAASETAYDPTLVVGYGGLWGENYWYEHTDVWLNERLLRFTPRELVDRRSRRRNKYPPEELHHIELARSAAELARRGVPVSVSAHGQMQGICSHWDLWMFEQGGLTRHEALKTATINGARALGLDRHVGSIEVGKLADLIVMNENPLEHLRESDNIHAVMKNGRLYDGMTLAQILPDAGPPPELPAIGLLFAGSDCCANLVR